MDWPLLSAIAYIAAGVAVSGMFGYATADSRRLFWGGLAAVLFFPIVLTGPFTVGTSNPVYLGILLLVIVPWLLGGFVARRGAENRRAGRHFR